MSVHKRLYGWIESSGFLPDEKVSDFTHTDISGGATRIRVDGDESVWTAFFDHYCEDLLNDTHHFLSEIADPAVFRAFIDIDLKFDANIQMDADLFLRPMLRTIQRATNDCFGFLKKPELLEMWVVTRPSNKKDRCTTHGFHVHWPNLLVNLETMQDLRSVIVKRLVDESGIQNNSSAGWDKIIDDLYSPRPKLRLPLSDKAISCLCKKKKGVCSEHGRGKLRVPNQSYNTLYAVVDASGKKLSDVMKCHDPLCGADPGKMYNQRTIKAFVRKLSIRATGAICSMHHPADFEKGYGSLQTKRRRGAPKKPISDEEKVEVSKRERAVVAWVSAVFGVECGACEFSGRGANAHYLIQTTSRFCANKGGEHENNGVYITVNHNRASRRCHSKSVYYRGSCADHETSVTISAEMEQQFFGNKRRKKRKEAPSGDSVVQSTAKRRNIEHTEKILRDILSKYKR